MQTTRARPWPDYKASAAALCSHTRAARPGVTCDHELRHLKKLIRGVAAPCRVLERICFCGLWHNSNRGCCCSLFIFARID